MSFFSVLSGAVVKWGCYLTTDNPFDVFNKKGAGIFDNAIEAVSPYFKDAYGAILIIGICLMALAGMGAITVLGLSKNDKKVAENKSFLMRVLGCIAGLGLFVSVVGIIWKVVQGVDNDLKAKDAMASAQIRTAQVLEIPYYDMEDLF